MHASPLTVALCIYVHTYLDAPAGLPDFFDRAPRPGEGMP